MMKRTLILLTILMASQMMQAQFRTKPKTTDATTSTKKSSFETPSKDYVMLQFGYDTWTNVPDSIKLGGIGRAFNAYVCYDFPIKSSNFSFAPGIGIASSNIFLKNQQMITTDTLKYVQFGAEDYDFKKYKFNLSYIEAPFELRYFSDKINRNKGIKAGFGLKVGALINAHTKSKRGVGGKPLIVKESTRRYMDSYRFQLMGRVGYGNFSVYAQYGLNSLFKIDNGPQAIRPLQIGLCISGM